MAIAPYDGDLEGALFKYETFPRLRHDLFPEPREIRSLVTGELYNRKLSTSMGVSGQIRLEALEKLQRSASSSNMAASIGSNKPHFVSSSQFRSVSCAPAAAAPAAAPLFFSLLAFVS